MIIAEMLEYIATGESDKVGPYKVRYFFMITEMYLIPGFVLPSGNIVLDESYSAGYDGQYSMPCTSYQNMSDLKSDWRSANIIWISTDVVSNEQMFKANELRLQWIAQGYRLDEKEITI